MSNRIMFIGLVLIIVGLTVAGCQPSIHIQITPTSAMIEEGGTVTFTVSDYQGNPVNVSWSVTSGPGTITAAGVYTAPASVDSVSNATVTATRTGNPNITTSATVTITKATLIDALGDTFGPGTYDIKSLSTSRTSTSVIVTITFDPSTIPTIPTASSTVGPGDLAGFITFDTDENSGTGIVSANSLFCPSFPSSAIGVDYFVSLFLRNGAGNYDIIETTGFTDVGDATPSLNGNVLTLTMPLTALGGDDGITFVNSVEGDDVGPTDCIPDEGAAVVTSESLKVTSSTSENPYLVFLDNFELDWQTPSYEVQTPAFEMRS